MAEFNESAEDFVDGLAVDNEDGDVSSPQDNFVESINFSDLEILEMVGRGAYGVVQKAKWKKRFIVAVKTIEDFSIAKEDVAGEVNGLSRVRHENVIRLYGTSQHKGKVCLVMEYAEWGSLYNLLHPSELNNTRLIPYTFGHVISWALQCALAVEYLHNLKPNAIIHRDLKPPNMLLTEYGTKLKICDFGTATVQKTQMTCNKGSAAWMAPEVFEGTNYSNTCDVYSFGIILWEMITRRKPFDDLGHPFSVMFAVSNGRRPPPVQGIPKCFEDLMVRCWAKDRNIRPQFTFIVQFLQKAQQFVSGGDEPLFAREQVQETPSTFPETAWEDSQVQTSIPHEIGFFPEEKPDAASNADQEQVSVPEEEAIPRRTFPPNNPFDSLSNPSTPDYERSSPYGTPESAKVATRSRNTSAGSIKSQNEATPVPHIIRTIPSNEDVLLAEQENHQRHQHQQYQQQQLQQFQQQQPYYLQQFSQRTGYPYPSMPDGNYPVFHERHPSQTLPLNRPLFPTSGQMSHAQYQDMLMRQNHPPYVLHQRSDPEGSTDSPHMSFDLSKTMPPADGRYNPQLLMNYNQFANPTNRPNHPGMHHSMSMQSGQPPIHPQLHHSNTTGHLMDLGADAMFPGNMQQSNPNVIDFRYSENNPYMRTDQPRSEFDLSQNFRAMSIEKSPGDLPSTRKKMYDQQMSHVSSTGSSRSSTPSASDMFRDEEGMAHSPKGMTSARRSDSKLPYRRQKSDLEVSRHGSRNVEVSLFQQDYMPLPPLPNRPESVKLWEQHMEALDMMAEMKSKYRYLEQRGEEIDKQLLEQKKEQQRNSVYLEQFLQLEKEKSDLLLLHREAKTQLERARSARNTRM